MYRLSAVAVKKKRRFYLVCWFRHSLKFSLTALVFLGFHYSAYSMGAIERLRFSKKQLAPQSLGRFSKIA